MADNPQPPAGDKPESAHDKFAREHPFAPTGWGPPDVKPAEVAVARMQRAFDSNTRAQALLAKPPDDVSISGRLRRLEDLVAGIIDTQTAILASLNGATIEAVCNEDSTITVTLTLPDLPA